MSVRQNNERPVLPLAVAGAFESMKRNGAFSMENTMQNMTEQFEKMNRDCMSRLEEAAAFNRCNVDAALKASNAVAEGMKEMSEAVLSHVQQATQSAMAAGKAMMGVKTMRELMDIQAEYMRATLDAMMAEGTRISEITVRCTTEAAEPLNARMTDVVEKLSERARKAA